MKKRVAAVLLVLCLVLGACDGRQKQREEQGNGLTLAAELSDDSILLTIDGREIPSWRYLYWLAYACQRVQERYQESELSLDWETPVAGGTLADYVKDQALADTALYATVENWAERYGCTVSPEELQNVSSYLPDLGLTDTQMAELERVGQMYAKLYDLYCTEGSELAPAQETLAVYAEKAEAVTLEQLLIPFGEDREAAQNQAAEWFSHINSAEDQVAAFSALAAEHGTRTETITSEDGQETLREAAKGLAEGQCSGILETEDGFSILRRLPLDTAGLKESCFDEMLQTAAEQSAVTITEAYTNLDPASFAETVLPKLSVPSEESEKREQENSGAD